ncbi:MAG: thymidine kinase [Myxococcales bacterium]|nr:thymidine kinase [Myxococcales bacterium]USN51931.1 MAG: thymidine kinase [Myxococcales bacterium]
MNGHSNLEIICGPMFSGKTEELIRRIRRVEYARMNAIVFKPEIDARYSRDLVVSHSEQKISSVPVPNAARIRDYLGANQQKIHVVGLDEVQFFDDDVIYLCEDLVAMGIRVIAAGLCEDYLGRPFGPMPDLLAHADTVSKLWAVCMRCGAPASKTQRVARSGTKVADNQVLVGADSCYEARCRACHVKGIVELIDVNDA